MFAIGPKPLLVGCTCLLLSMVSAGAEVAAAGSAAGSTSEVDPRRLHPAFRWPIQDLQREIDRQPQGSRGDASEARIHGRLGDLFLVAGALDAAAASYAEAARSAPGEPRWSDLSKAVSRLAAADDPTALPAPDPRLARVFVRWADRPPLLRGSAEDLAAPIVAASFQTFHGAVAADPRDAAARRDLGAALALTGRLEAAKNQLREAIRLDPTTASHGFLLFLVLEAAAVEAGEGGGSGDDRTASDEADAALRRAVEMEPGNPVYRIALARRLAGSGRIAEAAEHYETLVELVPGDHEVRLERGESRLATGDVAAALEDARAVEASPVPELRAAALQLAGEALSLQGRRDAAAEAFRRALTLDPSLSGAHVGLANLLGLAGEYDLAAQSYRRGVEIDPTLVTPRLGEATALALGGRLAAAIERLEDARRELGDLEPILFNLARLLLESPDPELRDPQRAVEVAEVLVAGAPTPSNGELLAVALATAGRFGDAAAMQQNLLKAAPPNTDPELLDYWRKRLRRWRDLAEDGADDEAIGEGDRPAASEGSGRKDRAAPPPSPSRRPMNDPAQESRPKA